MVPEVSEIDLAPANIKRQSKSGSRTACLAAYTASSNTFGSLSRGMVIGAPAPPGFCARQDRLPHIPLGSRLPQRCLGMAAGPRCNFDAAATRLPWRLCAILLRMSPATAPSISRSANAVIGLFSLCWNSQKAAIGEVGHVS